MDAPIIGIDTSKDRLDVHVLPLGEAFAVAQDEAGLADLSARLADLAPRVVAIEASGGYERAAVMALAAAGVPIVVVNPRNVRAFADALGQRAKTDAIDAKVIALFAEAVKLEARVLPDEAAVAFADLVARHKELTGMRTTERLRLQRATSKRLKQSIVPIVEALDRQLAELDRDIGRLIEASPLWRGKDELIQSAPGFGPKISRTMIADLPELGHVSGKEIAALAGLAPFTRQSGKYRGRSKIGGGRTRVRSALFIAAMVASRCDDEAKAFRQRLADAGKPNMVALVALARKLLVRLNAMLRDGTPWTATAGAAAA